MSLEVVDRIIDEAKNKGENILDEVSSKVLLKTYGVEVVQEHIVSTSKELDRVLRAISFPVVLKGVVSGTGHKSELGLVHTNITSISQARNVFEKLINRSDVEVEAVVVQPHIKGTREILAGFFRDRDFGPVVLFGLGGIYTEALEDVSFKVAPLEEIDALECIREIRSNRILGDFRGEKAADEKQLQKILLSLSRLALDHPEIKEIDINPLIITPEGRVVAVDALVVLDFKDSPSLFPFPVSPHLLKRFFYPRSVVFIGASGKIGKWGHLLPTNVLSGGYQGDVYLVNKKGGELFGKRVYKGVEEIPDNIDMAVVTIPASSVLELLPSLASKGIKHILLIASGFGETGEEGKRLQKKLVEMARKEKMVIIGPNTMGLCNPHINFHCMGTLVQPRRGHIAMVSQSGNMGVQLLSFASEQGIGIRGFCGSGNEAMVTIEDYLDAISEDNLTETVMLYVESVKNGRRFFEVAKALSRKKPIILLKGGETEAGVHAASTHTGAMASNTKVFSAMCRQAGIVKVDTPVELLDLAACFSSQPLPRGNRVVIITLGGGWGVVTADLCAKYGLKVVDLPQELISFIDAMLPDYWSRANPIDLVGEWDIEIPKQIISRVLEWGGCDAIIHLGILGRKFFIRRYTQSIARCDFSYSKQTLEEIMDLVRTFEKEFIRMSVELVSRFEKPIIGVRLNTEIEDKTVYEVEDFPYNAVSYDSPERAVKACARMYEYYKYLSLRGGGM